MGKQSLFMPNAMQALARRALLVGAGIVVVALIDPVLTSRTLLGVQLR